MTSCSLLYARHRDSSDHDHVVADLASRFDAVLEALESDPDWVLNRVTPGKIILGSLGDIEAGVRQLMRRQPLQVHVVTLPGGAALTVPTAAETLRIKGYLIVKRNQTRDYVDVAALADRFGFPASAAVLSTLDDYYDATVGDKTAVASQLLRQLGHPRPKDSQTTTQLSHYRNLTPRWASWSAIVQQCQKIADAMLTG
ncbi:hypothetical protein [Mycobacterium sp.]